MKDLQCPYCHEWCAVPDDCYGEDTDWEHECPNCDKIFMFHLSYIPVYEEYATPCLNEGEHKWEEIHGSPKEYFEHRRRCAYCGEEKEFNEI